MKLLFKQRLFSWFDSYDIYDENGNPMFEVRGKLSWGHRLEIYDVFQNHVGTVKEEIFTFLPRFALYEGGQYIGHIQKKFTLFRDNYTLECHNLQVQGDFFGWDYEVTDEKGRVIMSASKQLWNLTDTYTIHVKDENYTLISLMIVLAIDAAKCSQNN